MQRSKFRWTLGARGVSGRYVDGSRAGWAVPKEWTGQVRCAVYDKIPEMSDRVVAKPTSMRVAATLNTAQLADLLAGKKEKRVSGRAHEQLFRAAAERSGLDGSDLIEYALAKVALENDFANKLLALTGKVSREIALEF